jgi:molybdopterin molybdotransferase
VAILGSGDELVRIDQFDQVLAGRRIVSSNAYTIAAMIEATGGEAIDLGHCEDTLPAMRALLERALALAPDLIVTTAGVSVGEFDHTRAALEAMGARMDFWKVRMRPGAPLGFGHLGATPWIGLPGNPVSAMVTCELFVRPAIRRMLGYTRVHRQPVRVQLDEAVTIHAKLTHFLRAIVSPRADGGLSARLTGPQGSSILTSMSLANALLIVPEDRSTVAAGESLSAFLLSDAASMGEAFTL